MQSFESTNYETKKKIWGWFQNKETFHYIVYMEKYGLVPYNQFTNELNKTLC